MWLLTSVPAAIGLMVAGIFLLGFWPVCWNVCEKRGRLPAHTFLDYCLTYLTVGVVTSLTLGQIGAAAPGSANFFDQLSQPNGQLVAFAVAGGVCLAVADIAVQWSVAFVGLSVGPPVLNAVTIIIGVILTYFLDGGLNKPQLVFPGMALSALAIFAGMAAHITTARSQARAGQGSGAQLAPSTHHSAAAAPVGTEVHAAAGTAATDVLDVERTARAGVPDSVAPERTPAQAATAAPPAAGKPGALQRQNSIRTAGSSVWLGLLIAIAGGVVCAFFIPAFQIATNDPFQLLPEGTPPLSIYTANFYFSIGFTSSSGLISVWLLYRPWRTQPSSLGAWLADHNCRGWSVLSGVLASLGDYTVWHGGQVAGYAAATLVLAYPIIGVVLGLLHFREHRGAGGGGEGAPRGARSALALVLTQAALYIASVGLLAASAELRSTGPEAAP